MRLYLCRTDTIPTEAAEQAGMATADGPVARILVIDDDPDVRSFLSESLASLGYTGVIKDDGADALSDLDRIDPDIMIVDFAMPGMNGAELAQKVRALRPDLPILFASGYAETAALDSVMRAHTILLRKPFGIDELQSALTDLLADRTI